MSTEAEIPPLEYLEVEQARGTPGLKLVLSAGVPGPWGEASRAYFDANEVPYTPVRQLPGHPNEALVAWTGSSNAPQAVYASEQDDDEPARTNMIDILMLSERLSKKPRLVPTSLEARVEMFGLMDLLTAPGGLGWLRRLQILDATLAGPMSDHPAMQPVARLGRRYGYSPEAAAAAPKGIREILELLAARLAKQEAAGGEWFVGDSLSAMDLTWATFAVLIRPLPDSVCPIPGMVRQQYEASNEALGGAVDPRLIRHRDRVYERVLELPVRS